MILREPPAGSDFRIDPATERLQWVAASGGGFMRSLMALFMLAWLCGWAIGEVTVISELLSKRHQGLDYFLAAWLCGWTIGGIFACTMLVRLTRGPTPDIIQFSADSLSYVQGSRPFPTMVFDPYEQKRQLKRFLTRRKTYRIERRTAGQFKLERVGERQRLTIDVDSDRIEIGEELREPDREWLFTVLSQWKSSGG